MHDQEIEERRTSSTAKKGKVRIRWLDGTFQSRINLSPIPGRIPSLSHSASACASNTSLLFVEIKPYLPPATACAFSLFA